MTPIEWFPTRNAELRARFQARSDAQRDVDAFAVYLQFGDSTDPALRADETHTALARAMLEATT